MRAPRAAPALPPPLLLLLLLGPAARAAPRDGVLRPEPLAAVGTDPGPDPLSPDLPALQLLRSAVRSLGPPQRDADEMTREQALLFLFAMHDHDRSGQLDGLELLQLLGAVLTQGGAGRPSSEAVAALVDRALEQRDRSGDGLLDLPELLLPAPARGPPRGGGAALEGRAEGHAGEQDGIPAVGEETLGENVGASSPQEGQVLQGDGDVQAEEQGIPKIGAPLEEDETAESETAIEDREPRVEPSEAPASPALGDPREM
ncbi:cell growth regulator with EF hand domain protein 1 [Lagopus leucura]|uniref:cell growth regulator with EF hand domain protein 1 n=1 Tax=Lagopus leucura TaxID=30410 RepID=UPI001C673915|nr:cell growth regulator with EF hand domain protein 1 [Lagopus leucura]